MASRNHKHSMSQPERSLWREAFLDGGNRLTHFMPLDKEIAERVEFANAAIEAYRKTITWRSQT